MTVHQTVGNVDSHAGGMVTVHQTVGRQQTGTSERGDQRGVNTIKHNLKTIDDKRVKRSGMTTHSWRRVGQTDG